MTASILAEVKHLGVVTQCCETHRRSRGSPVDGPPRPERASIRQYPHLHRVVRTSRCQAFAVGTKGHAIDSVCVPLVAANLPGQGHVPNSCGRILKPTP